MRAAFVGMSIVAASVFVLLILPLVVFFGEILSDPQIFAWSWTARSNDDGVILSINLTYSGSVPLKDFRFSIVVDGEEYSLESDELVKGSVVSGSVKLNVTPEQLGRLGFKMSFKIAGIYRFSLGVLNG